MNKKKYTQRLCWPLVFAIACFILVWVGFYVISYPVINEYVHKDIYNKYTKEGIALITTPDTIKKGSLRTLKEAEEAIRCIESNQKIITDRQADLINDVRQETNNNIDKLNLFAAFSIGVISIFGIFIPLIAQNNNNKEVKESIEDIDKHKHDIAVWNQKNLDEMHRSDKDFKNKIIKEIKENITESQKEFSKIRKDFEQQSKIQKFRMEFMALSLGYDDRILSVHPDRCKQMRMLWIRTMDALVKMVEFSKSSEKDVLKERRDWLMESFVLTGSFIRRIRVHVEGRERILDRITDAINQLLSDLEYDSDSSFYWDIIYEKIDSIMADIHEFRFE